jgi:hypothetical protein
MNPDCIYMGIHVFIKQNIESSTVDYLKVLHTKHKQFFIIVVLKEK